MKKVLIGIPVLNNMEITRACLQHLYQNWCSTRQGPNFDGQKWDKARGKLESQVWKIP